MRLRKLNHTVYRHQYHIVWVTKYRRKILNPGLQLYITKALPKVLRTTSGVELLELGMEADHVHVVLSIPPHHKVSEVVSYLKQQLASMLLKRFEWLRKVYWKERVLWSVGYFSSTIGVNESTIRKYVRWQGREDSGQSELVL